MSNANLIQDMVLALSESLYERLNATRQQQLVGMFAATQRVMDKASKEAESDPKLAASLDAMMRLGLLGNIQAE